MPHDATARAKQIAAEFAQKWKPIALKREGAEVVARREARQTSSAATAPMAVPMAAAPAGFEWGGVF